MQCFMMSEREERGQRGIAAEMEEKEGEAGDLLTRLPKLLAMRGIQTVGPYEEI